MNLSPLCPHFLSMAVSMAVLTVSPCCSSSFISLFPLSISIVSLFSLCRVFSLWSLLGDWARYKQSSKKCSTQRWRTQGIVRPRVWGGPLWRRAVRTGIHLPWKRSVDSPQVWVPGSWGRGRGKVTSESPTTYRSESRLRLCWRESILVLWGSDQKREGAGITWESSTEGSQAL